ERAATRHALIGGDAEDQRLPGIAACRLLARRTLRQPGEEPTLRRIQLAHAGRDGILVDRQDRGSWRIGIEPGPGGDCARIQEGSLAVRQGTALLSLDALDHVDAR